MRSGPKPLSFHLQMASVAAAGLSGAGDFNERDRLDYFAGIKKYQTHPYRRAIDPLAMVWQAGEARLLSAIARAAREATTPVICVPSMINRSDILDLMPGRSLVRWLADNGHAAHLFDWGSPAKDEGQANLATAIETRLIPALETFGRPVILLGYCMGGLFAAALAALRPDLVKGLILLATPWNFHDEAGALRARLSLMQPLVMPFMKQYRHVPESWMQAAFATLDPEGALRKFAGFARYGPDDPRADLFVAVEDWLNDGLDLPAGIADICFKDWYRDNLTYNRTWTVGGTTVAADTIRARCCIVAARKDRIVPLDAALAFADQRAKTDTIICDTGHVGLLAGAAAPDVIWPRISEWLRNLG